MPVHVFFNPARIEQLAARGITARREPSIPQGFVLNKRPQRTGGDPVVTHVIDRQGHVTITGQRQLSAPRTEVRPASTEPQTALELIEECARLRRDNQQLSDEVFRLRVEIQRLTTKSGQVSQVTNEVPEDDTSRRFSLLEFE